MKIWHKHLLGKLVLSFLFLIICLFGVYVIVDLSVHGVRFFSDGDSSIISVMNYYLYSLSILLELFITLAFLLSTMKVLFDLNVHREIVALQMASLSKKVLLTPFFLFATILSLICYSNSQWLAPKAQDTNGAFRDLYKNKKREKKIHLYSISLEDSSELIYQRYDPHKKEIFDTFWVRSPTDIWHMKSLQVDSLLGRSVNHLIRNSMDTMEKIESFEEKIFTDLPWDPRAVLHKFVPFENRALFTLIQQARVDSSERQSVLSHLFYKIVVPLMPFLVLIAIGPISLTFSRNIPLFLTALFSLFGFIALKVILDGMLILGENQVLPALVVIGLPISAIVSFTLPGFIKMR